MSSRTRARGAAGVHTVRIPHQRGRRSQPFLIVVPDRPSLTREVLGFLGRVLWRYRRPLAPTALALLAWPVTAILHAIAWWYGLIFLPVVIAPAVWFGFVQYRRPARSTATAWRIGLVVLATLAFGWAALASGFGPTAGPLPLVWLAIWLITQTAWSIVRRTH
ncbi:hypothetical protein [Streptomyces sp. NPDC050538]|uniref:hypothetical protein n=1 Tax=Streptomyces sp. NPDC050538 TaxID=3365627 RepID=UPI0037902479